MKKFIKENRLDNSLQENVMNDFDMAEGNELLRMAQAEDKLFDLQKEHFNNVRTLITASAAIASVDLLALQALKDIGLANWFLWSVILLYFSLIIFVLYLTLSSNVETKMFLERSGMAKEMFDIAKDKEISKLTGIQALEKISNQSLGKLMQITKTTQYTTKMLTMGNVLFVVGLLIPIIGFVFSALVKK